jgi:hypothetical protein
MDVIGYDRVLTQSSAVPEPATLTLLGAGALLLSGYSRRRRKQGIAKAMA